MVHFWTFINKTVARNRKSTFICMNSASNHEETEAYHQDWILWSHALVLIDGTPPSGDLNTSFMNNFDLEGYVAAADRDTVTGTYSGTLRDILVTIEFKASGSSMFLWWIYARSLELSRQYQYLYYPDVTFYQDELEAGIETVLTVDGAPTSWYLIEHMHPYVVFKNFLVPYAVPNAAKISNATPRIKNDLPCIEMISPVLKDLPHIKTISNMIAYHRQTIGIVSALQIE
ncbi:hypothetical protein K435DRAFT_810656 [Dendrothele bispora CBS 962.96]|uniref:Uncharacterized protein n=1 Tax=Dendrothele bispora (strain CBS 962.96) TaxID=1314807 RepID=A0A4V4HBI9_DENBC|nr:hypothetical protein K435DRAFT_812768 [Dendrothele bispora CBS 962.96]THU79525.1 hypothetical protein K435DRAFT_810656 [Dendrothele bispora CBS 962.96]